jgi:hypothetical protein
VPAEAARQGGYGTVSLSSNPVKVGKAFTATVFWHADSCSQTRYPDVQFYITQTGPNISGGKIIYDLEYKSLVLAGEPTVSEIPLNASNLSTGEEFTVYAAGTYPISVSSGTPGAPNTVLGTFTAD